MEWKKVKEMMEHYLVNLPINIYVYEEEYQHDKLYFEDSETSQSSLVYYGKCSAQSNFPF